MNRVLAVATWTLVAITPVLAQAPTVTISPPPKERKLELGSMQMRTGADFVVETGEVVPGDAYVLAAKRGRISGQIKGDLWLATPQADIDGTVDHDLNLTVSVANITGAVGDDLRVLASIFTLGGQVAGDAIIGAGTVSLDPQSHITGAVVVYFGGQVDIAGRIDGPVQINKTGSATIRGQINGDLTVICDQLDIEPGAKIAGNLTYSARKEAHVEPGTVAGTVTRTELEDLPENADGASPSFSPFWFTVEHVYFPIVSLIAGILMVVFFGRFVNASLGQANTGSGLGMSFGIGFVAILVMVMAGIVCCFLLPMALAVWSLLGALFYFGGLIGKMLVGQWLLRPLLKRQIHPILGLLLGVFVLEIVGFIPVIGVLAVMCAIFTGIGAVLMQLRSVRQGEEVGGLPQIP
ncbi:MAG: polymer-forming cytoskeletal protein [Acidobacteriota bacterium]